MKNAVDLAGQRFGKLTVLERATERKRGQLAWRCRCDCGGEAVDTVSALRAGARKHCGCASYLTGSASRAWRGYGEIPAKLWSQIQTNARRRGINFSVTGEAAWAAYQRQQGRCALSGVLLSLKLSAITASLDRIESSKGYVDGNIQWLHKDVNMMKRAMTDSELVAWSKRIYEHSANRQGAGTEQVLASN